MVAGGIREATFERNGQVWRSDFGDEVGRTLFTSGGYESKEIRAVLSWLRQNPTDRRTLIDLGANIGTTSVPFAIAGYQVIAVEPVPHTFSMLKFNVDHNAPAGSVVCAQHAVADRDGVVDIWTGFGSGQAELAVSGHEPALRRWGAAGSLIEVSARPLAAILDGLLVTSADIALVWADVQGSESAVIRTGLDLWSAGVPLYLEVDPISLELHGGLGVHLALVASQFTSFIPSDDLVAERFIRRPIETFSTWVAQISADGYSNALLLP
jgi:FkbM family methyltransferase